MNRTVKKSIHPLLIVLFDIALIGIALVVFALFHHVLKFDAPKLPAPDFNIDDISALTPVASKTTAQTVYTTSVSNSAQTTAVTTVTTTPTEQVNNVFSNDEVIKTDTLYKSKSVSAELKEVERNGVTYFVVDIYVKYIQSLCAALPSNGEYNDYVFDIAKDNNAVCAINGDYFALVGGGAAIRNGTVLSEGADNDVCVLYLDGTMKTYTKQEFNMEQAIANGAWQAWDFGPSLLDSNGKALEEFSSQTEILGSNPRSAIGYYEPGHYCFVTVGGRERNYACGVKMTQLAGLFEELGCKTAYNLDGGKSAVMAFGDKIANEHYNGTGRKTTDIILIKDLETK